MSYLPSLEERRQRIIENCCGTDSGDGFNMDSDPGYNSDTAVPTALDKTLDKIKKKRKTKGGLTSGN